MQLPKASLEHWMREFYFDCKMDLGSSGVATYTFGDLRKLLPIDLEKMDAISFDDSMTRGCDGLRQAIANRWGNGNLHNVMTANGSNEMLYHIMSTLLEPGDEVILLDPIYHALSTVAETKGCNIKYWKMEPEAGFIPAMDDFKSLLTENTKLVAVNFPHNPTGVTITREQQKELIKLVSEVDAYLVWDAAFEEMTLGEQLPNPFLEYDKAISVGTLSKGYGLPGLRIGWCFASEEVIEHCVQLRDYTTLYISPLVEYVGQIAIENIDLLMAPKMKEAKDNLQQLTHWVEKNKDRVKWTNPQGSVSCFIKFKGVEDTEQFCRDLVNETGVMLVPGECFGYKGYCRLGFGASKASFDEGFGLLTDFLKKRYWA
ncbi:capreomycidine synthase [Paraneptunicella aestuarii]|uniref:capreomycidine synthase n=1 Tax=Paraneptunicella aestuarii TaxID=2831148 RepID=UPI001E31F1F0|nr:capreomycidine synthase [Paraneptunicella aestuarii]UAA37217.1 capreomycidine synthase [Paraneptunicella aestuarii]